MTALAAWSAKRAFLDGLLDDANLFPPASLPMRKALRVHARDRESAYAFVQGSFVVLASRVDELARECDPGLPLALDVVLDVVDDDPLAAAVRRLDALSAIEGASNVTVAGLDVRLPGRIEDVPRFDGLIEAIVDRQQHVPAAMLPALWAEPRYDAGWSVALEAILPAVATFRANAAGVAVGAKLRCGSISPNGTPSVEELASFIVLAQHAGVPWKATALRRPVRSIDPVHGPLHGFLNVFVAALALHAGAIDDERVAAIVAEQDSRAFVLDPAHLGWRDVSLDAATIGAGRAHAVSFGSSSFFEPVEGLRELGLLA